MNRFHINPKDYTVGPCQAEPGNCPFGGVHYANEEEASKQAALYLEMLGNKKSMESRLQEEGEEAEPEGAFNISAPEIGVHFHDTFTPFNEKIEHVAGLWAELREEFPELSDWRLYFSSYDTEKSQSVAFTNVMNKTVVFDDRWVNALDEKWRKNILLHEIAHILTNGRGEDGGHGEDFMKMFANIGGEGAHVVPEEETRAALTLIEDSAARRGYPPFAAHPALMAA